MDVETIAEAELRLGNAIIALKEGDRALVLEIRKHSNSLDPDWVQRTHDSLQEIREMICDASWRLSVAAYCSPSSARGSPCIIASPYLHQVGQRTFTSKLLSMPSTQRSR